MRGESKDKNETGSLEPTLPVGEYNMELESKLRDLVQTYVGLEDDSRAAFLTLQESFDLVTRLTSLLSGRNAEFVIKINLGFYVNKKRDPRKMTEMFSELINKIKNVLGDKARFDMDHNFPYHFTDVSAVESIQFTFTKSQ